ncbi:uncharacterized protein LOC113562068 isoform X2 [Ooceraea biroi]|uniref:uncharacterized protein LOC113562068 isoform X2 n=1 Tax=Ooceraea biroi TaxID=2015173 RepID=UPI000F07D061|nr:uncharacterized protein LOC113562068 isoform X2 [Ooceraea biroi]
MSIIFKRIILDNNTVMENETHILCEVENEAEESSSFDENDELHANTKNDEWSDETTRFILDKYADYLELVGPMKKFKNKKVMWMQIAKDMETVLGIQKTYIQCENRYKTVLRRKRICDKNNATSGSKRAKINFENELKQIATKDDSIEPEVLQSANKVVLNVKNTNVSESSNTLKNKKAKCNLLQTLIEIHKEKNLKSKNDMKRK